MRTQHLAIAAAAAWSFAAVAYALFEAFSDHGSLWRVVVNAAVLVAGSLGIATLISLDSRIGGLGRIGKIGVMFVGVGVAISAVTWGAVNVYLLVQGVGYLVFGTTLVRTSPSAPKAATAIVAGAFFTAPIAFLIADAAQIGTPNEYGDRDAAFALGFVVGASFMAIGLIGWARWLQQPDLPTTRTQPIDSH